jgi:hypothetical protein
MSYSGTVKCKGARAHRDWRRSGGGAVWLADRYAALPTFGRRVVGSAKHPLPSRRIARLVFVVDDGSIGVVHGFIKKTQKTPEGDLEIARKRMKEMKA